MAKLSMILREQRRAKLIKKYAKKRQKIKESLQKAYLDERLSTSVDAAEQVMQLQRQLAELPRDSVPSRYCRRCALTGRSRGVYRKFGLGRNKLREYAMEGHIPGLTKASW